MITTAQLTEISQHINVHPLDESILGVLRKEFPNLHFTYCLDDDIGNYEPVLRAEHFNLYLIDGREHCLCLTNNLDVATGIVVAEVVADE